MKRVLALVGALAVFLLIDVGEGRAAATKEGHAAATKLIANVGPGATISLRTQSGRAINSLAAGKYTIVVRDRSPGHSFHLRGPAAPSLYKPINRSTGVSFVGTAPWNVTLRRGRYVYFCDRHPRSMIRTLRVQ